MRAKFSRLLKIFLCSVGAVLWLVTGLLATVSAESVKSSLTLNCRTDETILSGLHWDLYRVGSRVGPDFVLEGDFAKYPVDLTDFSVEAIETAAKTLENYAVTDNIPPLASGATNSEGIVEFDNLSPGLYLLSGDTLTIDNIMYIPSTLLLEIDNSGEPVSIDAYPKIIFRTESTEIMLFTLKKIWQDSDGNILETDRSVTAEIYHNGVLYETVELTTENDRTYTWYGNINDEWRVIEVEVPEDCNVRYDYNDTQFAIINKQKEEVEVTTNPATEPETEKITDSLIDTTKDETEEQTEIITEDVSEDITEDVTDASTTPSVEETSDTTPPITTAATTTPVEEDIPQTGQLWWPVPLLGFLGVVFIAFGLRISTEESDEKK